MGDPINTGPGGFDIDGQEYTFDVGLPEAAGGAQGPRSSGVDVSAGYLDEAGRPKDLTKKTKTTLAQYLSRQTLGQGKSTPVANDYPIDPSYNEAAITTPTGRPAVQSPGAPPPDNTASFAGGDPTLSSVSQNYASVSSQMRKGKADRAGVDGNDLLAGLPGDSTYVADAGKLTGAGSTNPAVVKGHVNSTSVVESYVSTVMATNRFSSAASAFTQTGGNSDAGFNPALTQQGKLGVYDPQSATVTPGRMASIGPLLTMRAGKELGAASNGADPNSAALQAGALLPGLSQLGVSRVDAQVLTAADVLQSLTTDELDGANVLSFGNLSWGQLNNTDDPFSGTDALGMLALSTALVAGVEVLVDGLQLLLGLITPQTRKPARDAQGRYSLGEYFQGTKDGNKASAGGIGGALTAITSLNFGALLGIQPTNFPFNLALSKGTSAFFGVPDSNNGVLGQLAGAASSSTDSPGFNVVVARAIIRSSVTVVDQLKKVGGNVMNAITQVLALVDTIRSSKLIAACNVFAALGDSILSNPAAWNDPDTSKVKVSEIDSADDDVHHVEVRKNRLKGSLKLAWASNRAPANLLLPSTIAGTALVAKGLGQFSPFLGIGEDAQSKVQTTVTTKDDYGRIDTVTAMAFEDALGASYVPFYFHDIRTNEMVSFHAFLASLGDSYQASLSDEEGFGRVEGVPIYKGTKRRINLSFYIAATSMADFDDMYVKINKLVTLVYPQYTQGVQLSSADGTSYRFTQPFSQLVGASPLIRLRLGDLIRSNYSLFALGRLFGMGDQDFALNGKTFTGDTAIDSGALENLARSLADAQANPSSETYYPAGPGSYDYYKDPGPSVGGVGVPIPSLPGSSGDGPSYAPKFDVKEGIWQVKVRKIHPDNPKLVIGEVSIRNDASFTKTYQRQLKAWDNLYNNDDMPLQKVVGGTYVFPVSMLTPTDKTKSTLVGRLSALESLDSQNSGFASELTDFLNPDNNAVAKSFKDTGGKGLAGFIESLDFDWYDRVTWEVQPGRVAPKMVRVNVSFRPVHDITPGLDHHGFNRSPVYPVGLLAPQE